MTEREREREARSVVVAARMRQGLAQTEAEALSPLLSTELGRLCVGGVISQEQHDAGAMFARCYSRQCRALGIPQPRTLSALARLHPSSAASGLAVGDVYAVQRYVDAARLVSEAHSVEGLAVLRAVCLFDEPTRQRALLVAALSTLVVHFFDGVRDVSSINRVLLAEGLV